MPCDEDGQGPKVDGLHGAGGVGLVYSCQKETVKGCLPLVAYSYLKDNYRNDGCKLFLIVPDSRTGGGGRISFAVRKMFSPPGGYLGLESPSSEVVKPARSEQGIAGCTQGQHSLEADSAC